MARLSRQTVSSTVSVSVRVDSDVYDKFLRMYPDLIGLYLRRAAKAAVMDISVFHQIFDDLKYTSLESL